MPRFPTSCRRLCCSRRVPCSHNERRLAYHKPPCFTDHARPTALLVPRSVVYRLPASHQVTPSCAKALSVGEKKPASYKKKVRE